MSEQFSEKNPNGGYQNKSSYGADGWYGVLDVTPELLAHIQVTGRVVVETRDIQVTQYGECRRTVLKPYTPKQQQAPALAQAQPQYQAQPQAQYRPAPAVAQPASYSPPTARMQDDVIPF